MQKNLLQAVNLKPMKKSLVLLFLFISYFNYSQSWQWAMSGGGTASDQGYETCVDPSGNVFVAGTFNSISINIGTVTVNNSGASGFDVYVAKVNPSGSVMWVQRIGGSSNEGVSGISCDNAGRVYVFGTYTSPSLSLPPFTYGNPGSGTNNLYLTCIDASGVPQWLNGYGGVNNEFAGGCEYSQATSAIYITGTYNDPTLVIGTATLTNTSATGNEDIYIAKIGNTGVFQWARTTGSSSCDDWGQGIAVDPSGNAYIFGDYQGSVTTPTTVIGTTTLTSYGLRDLYIAKYNSLGTFQWARGFGSTAGGDFTGGITTDASSNVYVSGTYQAANMIVGTTTLTPYGNYDAFIAKYNTSGTAQWAAKVGGGNDDYGYDVTTDASGNAYMSGTFSGTVIAAGSTNLTNSNPGTSTDAFVAKYSATGSVLWSTKAGGNGNENGGTIVSDPVGNVYAGGSIGGTTTFGTYSVSSAGGVDMFLGKIGCLTTGVSGFSSVCQGSSVTLTASGAATYSWSTGATTTTIAISPTVSTNYTVTGTSGSCVGTPATFSVTFLPASLSAGSNLNMLCKQKAVINATCNPASPASVVWSPATNLSSASVLNPTVTAGTPTTYTVNVTLSNGCIKSSTVNVSSYAQTPDICQVTVDSLGNNNEIYWEKTLYPQADSFVVYRETSTNVYTRIAALKYSNFSMYIDTNRSIGPFNGNPNLTYYKYKLQIKDSCGNVSPMSLWHETIFVQDQMNGNFNWNSYAIESSASPVSSYNLKRRDLTTGTETLVVSTGGNLATDPNYNTVWPTNIKWFVDAIGFNCTPTLIAPPKYGNNNQILVTKTKTKSNQSNDKIIMGIEGYDLSNVIKVYPNPARDFINVDLNGLSKSEVIVEIRNVLGQVVYSVGSLNQYLNINTGSIAGGVYILNIIQNSKVIATKKVVVEK